MALKLKINKNQKVVIYITFLFVLVPVIVQPYKEFSHYYEYRLVAIPVPDYLREKSRDKLVFPERTTYFTSLVRDSIDMYRKFETEKLSRIRFELIGDAPSNRYEPENKLNVVYEFDYALFGSFYTVIFLISEFIFFILRTKKNNSPKVDFAKTNADN